MQTTVSILLLLPIVLAYPIWEKQFNIKYFTRVEKFGDKWFKPGRQFYNWDIRRQRADYYTWCLPLFDDPTIDQWDFTCSYLLTEKGAFFLSEPNKVVNTSCCIFETQLPPPTPDWLSQTTKNVTEIMNEVWTQKWWFQGPPFYGYWHGFDSLSTPVRFLGLSALDVTVLDYYDYEIGLPPASDKLFEIPPGCTEICKPNPPTSNVKVGTAKISKFLRPQ